MITEPVLVIQLLNLTRMIQYKWLLTFQEMMLPWRGQKFYRWNSNCHRSKSPLSLLKEIFSFSLHLSFEFATLQVTSCVSSMFPLLYMILILWRGDWFWCTWGLWLYYLISRYHTWISSRSIWWRKWRLRPTTKHAMSCEH